MARVINFNAGPSALPLAALERAQRELLDFANSGMSVMEHSHRGREYEAVHDEALSLLRELLQVPATHDILFVQGGATQQFAQVPMNFLGPGGRADHVVTGVWGEKALSEAQVVGKLQGGTARALVDAAPYHTLPETLPQDPGATYVHLTSNETIHGIQFAVQPGSDFPKAAAPLVVDMSSDLLWRPMDVSRFAFIYAGAQKNLGPSGIVVLIAHKDFLATGRKDIPKIFQYRTVAEARSLYNTPPTFAIYLVRNVLAVLKEQGGLAARERENRAKAAAVYDVIDQSQGFYRCPVDPKFRSVMNLVFRLPSEALEDQFVAEAKKAGMVGLKGHRSVGGIRVSLYNAVTLASAQTLASFMRAFIK
ncbi:MAG: 3-phosphoserine/phosphohydroxythreonine transaminase [Deltaproteobacteria bacterium]|nr:3-phosphoserine/phosphohydroxythreonine transaminase [Deltaproteobacteria bacterium]